MSAFDVSTIRKVTEGLLFPEGPIALDDGTVLVSEIEGGSLARVRPDGTFTRIDCGGGVNGAALGPDGAVYACNDGGLAFQVNEGGINYPYAAAPGNDGGYLQRVDLDTGDVTASNLAASGISVVSPAGELIDAFVTPIYDSYVTNVCFGGPGGDTAYVCSSGRGILYSVKWPWPGLRLNFAS